MKIKVDFDLCESNALCEAMAPEVFELDDDDFLQLKTERDDRREPRERQARGGGLPARGDLAGGLSVAEATCRWTAGSRSSPGPGPAWGAPRRSRWPRAGARVVLNDLPGAADDAADELKGLGAEVAIVEGDVGERSTADAMLAAAVEGFGQLDIVVNNAGMTRDRMLFNLSDEEWDDVIRVHLRGHFLLSRNAASYWRERSKAADAPVYGRIVNTASEAFLGGSPGQANYAAAKAGIAALTLSSARGLGKIGVRANAICPRARTAMTAQVFGEDTSGAGGRPLLARARRAAGRLPRLAGRRPDHRPGLRRLRRDGGAGRRARRRAALRRVRLGLGPAGPRPAARRVLLRARPVRRLRRRLDHVPADLEGKV